MELTVKDTKIDAVKLVELECFRDERGFFMEAFRKDIFTKHGLPTNFVQFNHSGSVRNTVRGLHFQWEPPMGKLMRVIRGEAYLIAVDIRKGSPTLGQHVGVTLSEKDPIHVWAPAGFARGFAVLSDYAEIQYLTTGTYNHDAESGILWRDETLKIVWPVMDPILSKKDDQAQTLEEWLKRPESDNFQYA